MLQTLGIVAFLVAFAFVTVCVTILGSISAGAIGPQIDDLADHVCGHRSGPIVYAGDQTWEPLICTLRVGHDGMHYDGQRKAGRWLEGEREDLRR